MFLYAREIGFRRWRWMALCMTVLGTLAAGSPVAAAGMSPDEIEAIVEQATLTAADGVDYDHHGATVGISGETAVVGAPGDDIGANFGQGAAYVYQRNGGSWHQVAKLAASDGARAPAAIRYQPDGLQDRSET